MDEILIRLCQSLEIVHADGSTLRVPPGKAGLLLLRLATQTNRASSRSELVELIWPGSDHETGRNRLRVALNQVRGYFGASDVVRADRLEVSLDWSKVDTDVRRFQRAVKRAGLTPDEITSSDFLAKATESFDPEIAPQYVADWVVALRLELANQHRAAIRTCEQRSGWGPSSSKQDQGDAGLPESDELIGRSSQISDIVRQIGASRLVSLVGPGGVGKTCLSTVVGRQMRAGFPDGVYRIELSTLRANSDIGLTVRQSLGLETENRNGLPFEASFASRRSLLVFDNCEHVLDQVARLVRDLLANSSQLKILTTSRERLHLSGETVIQIEPLSFPEGEPRLSYSKLADYESVQLLEKRAKDLDPGFQLNDENCHLIQLLVSRVQGLPLAIELIAARLRTLSLVELSQRLQSSFAILSTSTAVDERQRTMRNSIAATVNLLDVDSLAFFARLSLLPPGWTLGDVLGIFGASAESDLLDGLSQLVDKSLVQRHVVEGGTYTFSIYESVREIGLQCLHDGGLVAEYRRMMVDYVVDYVWQSTQTDEPRKISVMTIQEKINRKMPLILEALEICLADGHQYAEAGFKIALGVDSHWTSYGLTSHGHRITRALVPFVMEAAPTEALARYLELTWRMAIWEEDGEFALSIATRLLGVAEALVGSENTAGEVFNIGRSFHVIGDLDRALDYYERAREQSIQTRTHVRTMRIDFRGCEINFVRGNFDEARRWLDRAMENLRSISWTPSQMRELPFFGMFACRLLDDVIETATMIRQHVEAVSPKQNPRDIFQMLVMLAVYSVVIEQFDDAVAILECCREFMKTHPVKFGIPITMNLDWVESAVRDRPLRLDSKPLEFADALPFALRFVDAHSS